MIKEEDKLKEKQNRMDKSLDEETALAMALEEQIGMICDTASNKENRYKHIDIRCTCNDKVFNIDFKCRKNDRNVFEILNDYGIKGSLFADDLTYLAHYNNKLKEVWFIDRKKTEEHFLPYVIMRNKYIDINRLMDDNIDSVKGYIIKLVEEGKIKTDCKEVGFYELYTRYSKSNKTKFDLTFEVPSEDIEEYVAWKFKFDMEYWLSRLGERNIKKITNNNYNLSNCSDLQYAINLVSGYFGGMVTVKGYDITCALDNGENVVVEVRGKRGGIPWIEILFNDGSNGWITSKVDYIALLNKDELLLIKPQTLIKSLLPKVKWYKYIDFNLLFTSSDKEKYIEQLINSGFIKTGKQFDDYELRRRSGIDNKTGLPYKDIMFSARWNDLARISEIILKA